MAGGIAVSADMWELAGTGGTPGRMVKSEAHGPGPGSLVGRVGIRAVAVAVVGAGAYNTVRLSETRECHSPKFEVNLAPIDS